MSRDEPDLWFSFVRAHRLMIREVERRLADGGLPVYAWYDLLWGLESAPGGTRRMHELADVLAIERYNLTRLIDRLEENGLVTRARSTEDGRAAYASITSKGRALRKKMWRVYESTVAELFLAQFGAYERRVFAQALDQAGVAARDSASDK
ncbi:MarR family winged helix-turn-helix transcriptional regulator [Caballeronia sp. 15711]|uniref:MarR family winged helix-turn-helix transcriptional regulator n=1 Tax=Caballeronia sp. 15711 TaxID=3391029 RepID=UPI0039E2F00E